MKTNLLKSLLLLAGAASVTVASAGEAREIPRILTEGKSWIIADVEREMSGVTMGITALSRIAVERDSIIDGKVYKVMSKCPVDAEDMKTWTLAYEENGVLYSGFFYSDLESGGIGMYKMLDMSLDEGGSANVLYSSAGSEDGKVVGSLEVTKVKTITVNGKEVRELITKYDTGIPCTNSYVEGVGAAREEWLTAFPEPITLTGKVYSYMIACYQGDECIFTADDFTIPGKTAQQTAPLLTEGKSWLFDRMYYNSADGSGVRKVFEVKVCGDTLVGPFLCKKLSTVQVDPETFEPAGDPGVITAYDYGSRVYELSGYNKDEQKLSVSPLMDFALIEGNVQERCPAGHYNEVLGKEHNLSVKEINTLTVNGVERKEIVLTSNAGPDGTPVCWVEGIGSSADVWISLQPDADGQEYPAGNARMIECRQDGEVIFTADDFTYKYEHASIRELTAGSAPADGALYDLLGRRILRPAKGQIYLQSGRKHLAR